MRLHIKLSLLYPIWILGHFHTPACLHRYKAFQHLFHFFLRHFAIAKCDFRSRVGLGPWTWHGQEVAKVDLFCDTIVGRSLTDWLADWPRSINRLRRQRSMFVWHFSSTFVVRAQIISIPNPERPRRFSSRLATHFPHTHSRTNLISAVSRRHSKLLFVTLLSPSSQVSLTSFQGVSDSHYLFR